MYKFGFIGLALLACSSMAGASMQCSPRHYEGIAGELEARLWLSCPQPLQFNQNLEYCCYGTNGEPYCCNLTDFVINWTMISLPIILIVLVILAILGCVSCVCCPCCCVYKRRHGGIVYGRGPATNMHTITLPVPNNTHTQQEVSQRPHHDRFNLPPGAYPVFPQAPAYPQYHEQQPRIYKPADFPPRNMNRI